MMREEWYKALIDKNPSYEGVFFVGVKTTGVFCRPTCPARKPKYEHCEFFSRAEEALLASYRPCKRCRPLSSPHQVPEEVRILVEAIEANPEKRWKDKDLRELSIHAAKARRLFKKRFGMTFIAYARARRLGIAMKQIREGSKVIDAQIATGYESGSGFRDAFSKIMGKAPVKSEHIVLLKAYWLDSPLGPMLAISDEKKLYLLEFVERRGLEKEIKRLRHRLSAAIIPGKPNPIVQIEGELMEYFRGERTRFETPYEMLGSPFQKKVWQELCRIPPGTTISYKELALRIGDPKACRAVARANGTNQIAIVIPCHRVINANGEIGGYGGGVQRKEWLLQHESSNEKY